MKLNLTLLLVLSTMLVACDSGYDDPIPNLGAELQSDCGSTSPRIGSMASFSTRSHDVSGLVTIIDDCTLEVSGFNYDGEGPSVFFYAALGEDYLAPEAFVLGDQLNGPVYTDQTLRLKLPVNRTLDDMDSLSVWCSDFRVSFGEAVFQ